MKTKNLVLALVIVLSSTGLFAQKLEVDTKKSSVEWLGKKIGRQHEGSIKVKSGSLELKDGKIVAGDFVIDMTTITNSDLKDEGSNKKLVGHLKSDDFFGVEKFPTAKLNIIQSTKFTNGKATVKGNITIKGKTESVSFEILRKGNIYTTKLDLDRSKFDVRYGSKSFFNDLGDKAINDIFTLNIKLVVI